MELEIPWAPYLLGYVNIVWMICIVSSFLVALDPISRLSAIAETGKLRQHRKKQDKSKLQIFSSVPKRYFVYFYAIGTYLTVAILLAEAVYSYYAGSSVYGTLPLFLFLIHCCKRWWECLKMTEFGESEIHIAGFLVGILHYVLVPVSIFLSNHEHQPSFQGSWRRIASTISLFFISSYFQSQCHHILFQLKRSGQKAQGASTYSLPRKGLFQYVCCPHYSTEIVLYVALWQTLPQSLTCLLIAVWTASNLSVMGYKQYFWYLDSFPDEFIDGDKKYWRILIPGVW